jgi:hypothetical protein
VSDILSVSGIADSFSKVSDTLLDLFNTYSIIDSNILGVQINPMGDNKFVINVTYT